MLLTTIAVAGTAIGISLLIKWAVNKIMLSPQGRYIFITGCDTGFGNLLAKSLDKKGCHVFATCLTSEGAESLSKGSSDRLHALLMDVTDSESIKAAFEKVNGILVKDSATLWGLVNNAGIGGYPGYHDWRTKDEYRRILEVNLLGPVDVTNTFLPLLRKGKGRVVNMSSGIGLIPFSMFGYEMSKCGLEGFSHALRQQLCTSSVSVHVVNPGFFATDMVINDRVGAMYDKIWERMPESQQNYYGRDCIDQAKAMTENMAQKADTRLYRVTDAIEHALFAWYPWRQYVVSSFIATLLLMSPAFVRDYLITKKILVLPKPKGVDL